MRQGMLASSSISIQVQIGQNHCLAIITFYVNITNLCTVLLNFILSPSCLALTREKFVPPQRINKKDTPLPVSALTASSLVETWALTAADNLQPEGLRVHATWSESQHKGERWTLRVSSPATQTSLVLPLKPARARVQVAASVHSRSLVEIEVIASKGK
jgi:hypothetical protein